MGNYSVSPTNTAIGRLEKAAKIELPVCVDLLFFKRIHSVQRDHEDDLPTDIPALSCVLENFEWWECQRYVCLLIMMFKESFQVADIRVLWMSSPMMVLNNFGYVMMAMKINKVSFASYLQILSIFTSYLIDFKLFE